MAIPHLSIRSQSRTRGQSMARALAYRCGMALVDVRTGRRHDYTRRRDREEIAQIGVGQFRGMDASWSLDNAQLLADRIDTAERRCNSVVARDLESALPCELDSDQQLALVKQWTNMIARHYRAPVPYAIHHPAADGDVRNTHVHVLLPDRRVADDGIAMGQKLRVLADLKSGPRQIKILRRAWQMIVNRHLRAAGIDESIDMGRSRPADQPSVHAGPRRTGRERRRQTKANIAPDGRGVLARAAEFDDARDRRHRARTEQVGRRIPRGRGRRVGPRRRLSAPLPGHRDAQIRARAARVHQRTRTAPLPQKPTAVTLRAARQATGARAAPAVNLHDIAALEALPAPRKRRRRIRSNELSAPRVPRRDTPPVKAPEPLRRVRTPRAAETTALGPIAQMIHSLANGGAATANAEPSRDDTPARIEPPRVPTRPSAEVPAAPTPPKRQQRTRTSISPPEWTPSPLRPRVQAPTTRKRTRRARSRQTAPSLIAMLGLEWLLPPPPKPRRRLRPKRRYPVALPHIPRRAPSPVRRPRAPTLSRGRSRSPARPSMRRTPGEIAALIAQARAADARVKKAKAEIAEILRRKREQHTQTAEGTPTAPVLPARRPTPAFEGRGGSRAVPRYVLGYEAKADGERVLYRRRGAPAGSSDAFQDVGNRIDVLDWQSEESTLAALELSARKWGGFVVTGDEEFKARCARLAAEHGFRISNPELKETIERERARLDAATKASADPDHEEAPETALDATHGRTPAPREPPRERDIELETASAPAPPTPRVAEELHDVFAASEDAASAIEHYGPDAVRLEKEFWRLSEEHGELQPKFRPENKSTGTLRFIDRDGMARHTSRESVIALAGFDALLGRLPPEEIPELEREITKAIAQELAQEHERGR